MEQQLQQRLQALTLLMENMHTAQQQASLQAERDRQTIQQLQQRLEAGAAVAQPQLGLRIDEYDGTGEKLEPWLFKLELATEQATDARRMAVAETHLTGAALSWLQQRRAAGQARPADWRAWAEELRRRFAPVNAASRTRASLHVLRHTGTLEAYINRFNELTMRLPNMEEGQKVWQFINGLRDTIRADVDAAGPETYDAAVRLADRYDQIRGNRGAGSASMVGAGSGTAMEVGFVGYEDGGFEELAVLRQQRQQASGGRQGPAGTSGREDRSCFYCGKPGHLKKECRTRLRDMSNRRPASSSNLGAQYPNAKAL